MAENKTRKTSASVADFMRGIADPQKRADCKEIAKMMRAASCKNAKMWGPGIVGYGAYDYKYDSGREGSFFLCGFSPRAQNLTIYIIPGFRHFTKQMEKLGRYKTGKSCLYIKKLDDVDRKVLQSLIERSVKYMRSNYKTY